MTVIDHIVITAPTLDCGAEFIWQQLGVEMQTGGEHPRMGTHNLLLSLGESVYLEVIAPNPDAPKPERSRWFGLDAMSSDAKPRLSSWVARTEDIQKTAADSSEPLGNIETMSRGALEWLITIPGDGLVPVDGVAPALIEWRSDPHPAVRLQDKGLKLVKLEIFHPNPERISHLLSSLAIDGTVSVSPIAEEQTPSLQAVIDSQNGLRKLSV